MAGLFKWGTRNDSSPVAASTPPPAPAAVPDTTSGTKVLPKFLAALSTAPAPVLMDLGPVVGGNISFFGEQLACKFYVEDLYAEIEKQRKRTGDPEPLSVAPRDTHAAGSIDGILCWDVFDYLDKQASQALSVQLVSLLKPGGALYGFFGTAAADLSHYTRFFVDSPELLRLRTVPATPTRRNVIVNRDLNKLFEGLIVSESVLLKSSTREILFRKP